MNIKRRLAISSSESTRVNLHFFVLAIVALAAGCASTYQLSPAAIVMKRNMTPKQAEDVLKELVFPANDSGRIFNIDTELPVCGNADVALNGSVMAYRANYRVNVGAGVEGSVQSGTARYVERYVIKTGRFKIDFRDVSKIQIWKTTDSIFKVPCPNIKPGYNVFVRKTATSVVSLIFNVNGEDLDRLLAALLYYSPEAEIKASFGL